MSENLLRTRVTIDRIQLTAGALKSLCDDMLEKNPKLFAVMAEAPIDDLDRMLKEVDGYLAEVKETAAPVTSEASI